MRASETQKHCLLSGPTSFPCRMTSLDCSNCSGWRRLLDSTTFRNSRGFLDLVNVQGCRNCSARHSHSLRCDHCRCRLRPFDRSLCRFRCFLRCLPLRCSRGHPSRLHSRYSRRFRYFRNSLNYPSRLSCRFLYRRHCFLLWQSRVRFPRLSRRPLRYRSEPSPGIQGQSTILRSKECADLVSSKRLTFAVGCRQGPAIDPESISKGR